MWYGSHIIIIIIIIVVIIDIWNRYIESEIIFFFYESKFFLVNIKNGENDKGFLIL